jgi:hypothetical protein
MNRRSFLKGLVATAAGVLVAEDVAAEPRRRLFPLDRTMISGRGGRATVAVIDEYAEFPYNYYQTVEYFLSNTVSIPPGRVFINGVDVPIGPQVGAGAGRPATTFPHIVAIGDYDEALRREMARLRRELDDTLIFGIDWAGDPPTIVPVRVRRG